MNPTNPYQWVEEYEAKLADLAKKSQDLEENVTASTATVSSKDNAVTVTVGPNGGLQNLVLGHRAVELGAPRLTSLILETARQAQEEASHKVLEVFKPIGEGTEAYRMFSDAIPNHEESEETDEVEEVAPAPVRDRRSAAEDEEDDNQPW